MCVLFQLSSSTHEPRVDSNTYALCEWKKISPCPGARHGFTLDFRLARPRPEHRGGHAVVLPGLDGNAHRAAAVDGGVMVAERRGEAQRRLLLVIHRRRGRGRGGGHGDVTHRPLRGVLGSRGGSGARREGDGEARAREVE